MGHLRSPLAVHMLLLGSVAWTPLGSSADVSVVAQSGGGAAGPAAGPAAGGAASVAPWWRREFLLPAPTSVALGSGRLKLTKGAFKLASTGVHQSSIVDAALARFPALVFGGSVQQCRLPPCNATRACNATTELGELQAVTVNLTHVGGNWSGLAQGSDESYTLEVTAAGVAAITAPTAAVRSIHK